MFYPESPCILSQLKTAAMLLGWGIIRYNLKEHIWTQMTKAKIRSPKRAENFFRIHISTRI
jgi:hypothetical protein